MADADPSGNRAQRRVVKDTPAGHPLPMFLQLAVGIEQTRVRAMEPAERDALLEQWRTGAADVLAAQGDVLLSRGPRRGDTAKVFVVLTRALVALSYSPGGVTFAGAHFCADHSPTT